MNLHRPFATTVLMMALVPFVYSQGTATQGSKLTSDSRPTELSNAEWRIRATLSDETNIDANSAPLDELLRQLGQRHAIPIAIDTASFKQIGKSPEQPVTLSLSGKTLGETLLALVEKLQVTYVIREDKLLITSLKSASQNQAVNVIPLPGELAARKEALLDEVRRSVQPDAWHLRGGPCKISVANEELLRNLGPAPIADGYHVIAHERIFNEIEMFLREAQSSENSIVSEDEQK